METELVGGNFVTKSAVEYKEVKSVRGEEIGI